MTNVRIANPLPAPRETLYSFISRVAATWRATVPDFAYDIGVAFKRLVEQDPEAITEFTNWVDLTTEQKNELLSWTAMRAGEIRMVFRGELFMSRALVNPVMRGCPVCLREDASSSPGKETAAMVMRGDWQMREASVCVRHRHPLVPLWEAATLRERFDIAARLDEIKDDLLAGSYDQPTLVPSAYDLWLDRRLSGEIDHTWLGTQSLYAVTTFCGLFGRAILKDVRWENGVPAGLFHAKGFNAAVNGPTAIRKALDEIAAQTIGHQDEPHKAFGLLYSRMAERYLNDPAFDQFRLLMRDCIIDHWPMATGEIVLGEVLPERKYHSLTSAAREAGVGEKVLEHFLVEAGALSDGDPRPTKRRLIDARKYAGLLTEIPTLVGPIAMRNAIGATLPELKALEESGLLIPRTRVAKVKNPWRISDGLAFLAELQTGAQRVLATDDDWETLLLARRRSYLALGTLVQGIRDGMLVHGQRQGIEGFHGIVVRKSDVNAMVAATGSKQRLITEALPGVVSAAAFGRSVGLRDHGSFIALIEAGETPAVLAHHPVTKRPQFQMDQSDIAAFHKKFVTLSTLVQETGLHRNALGARLSRARVTRYSPGGQDFGAVYLRSEVEAALR